jgi:hypothetical protein
MADHARSTARREFLRFLIASPYVAALGGSAAFLQQRTAVHAVQNGADAIASPAEALNVLDFEEPARRSVLLRALGPAARAASTATSRCANREGYRTCSCACGACAMRPRSTCASNCSAPSTTA